MRKINYQLIVSDFDGTLVNDDGTISDQNKQAIADYVAAGGAFAISTGRLPDGILKRAKELGDYLIVALSTDEFNWNSKQKKCYFSYEDRKKMLESIRYVDLVIPEENWEQKTSDVKEFKVDTFVMGDDWKGKFDFLKDSCEVVYLSRTPEISTTQIKHDLKG